MVLLQRMQAGEAKYSPSGQVPKQRVLSFILFILTSWREFMLSDPSVVVNRDS